MSSYDKIISDYSKSNLKTVPPDVLDMGNLKMLFLEGNFLAKLPDDFFHHLPYLMWLDLRNNSLESLPRSIANHAHLENLLLSNNNLQKLPNELGLVPNLKALQLAENPLMYPPRQIIQKGTKGIKAYLKEQYEKHSSDVVRDHRIPKKFNETRKIKEINASAEERVLKIVNRSSKTSLNQEKHYNTAYKDRNKEMSKSMKTKNLEKIRKNVSDPKVLNPTLKVKKIALPLKEPEPPLKIIHSINKGPSKILLKSYFNKPRENINLKRNADNSLRENWLNKLRILLNDQERILQQERNLQTLTNWRHQKKLKMPKVDDEGDISRQTLFSAPYATYPEYSKIPSRSELAHQLDLFFKNKPDIKQPSDMSGINMEKLINDLTEQLSEMEAASSSPHSPRSEMEQTGKQIHLIMDIHKKLLNLRAMNR